LKKNPVVGQIVKMNVNWSKKSPTHELIRKNLRCSGPDRKNIALKVSALGVSKLKIEHELENLSNSANKDCK
jgi:hypothetical protein